MKELDNEKIRENLRKLRTSSNLSQAEVAEKIGMNISTYKRLESASGTEIIHKGIEKLPKVLGVSAAKLILGEENPRFLLEDEASYGTPEDTNRTMARYAERLLKLGREMIFLSHEITAGIEAEEAGGRLLED